MKKIADQTGYKAKPEKKLLCSLHPKTKFVVHYAELKSALKLGFKITKIQRAISFLQSRWMAPYINNNVSKRKAAKNTVEKDFYKLLNNSVYGKTMENVRNRRDIKLTRDEIKKMKLTNRPWFKGFKDLGDGLFSVEMAKKKVVMNKPIAVGVAVLGWSKAHMFCLILWFH